MANEVSLVDALPYIDLGYELPGVRDAAFAMVDEECRRYRPTKNYLEHLPPLNLTVFETELMNNEFERIQNRLPMEPLSMKRYELPPPPPGKSGELVAWASAVDNSMAQLEHQSTRALNLDLMLEYGCEAWKAYLEIFTSLQAKAQERLQELKKEIQEVNWQRKTKQTQAGEKLRHLEEQWVMLVSKNYEIEQACAKLEEKIALRQVELEEKLPVPQVNGVADEEEQEQDEEPKEEEEAVAPTVSAEDAREDEPMENGDE